MQLPEKIGKYDILGVAGKGAMGIVYMGHDPFVDRKVAIKVQRSDDEFEDDFTTAKQARTLFFNEARSAGVLDHPNILKVYDAGDADGQDYIAMEYIEDVDTLKSYCEPEHLLPIDVVVAYMIKCADALHYAHEKGVTHRDIKPANIMLTRNGVIKIGDFGIAQRTQTEHTQLMGWFGSPMYMSPEQARDDPLNHQTDLFSLGIVMYQLLTGVQPFAASGIHSTINKILSSEPTPVHRLRPEILPMLSTIVERALEKDLEKRYQNGAELAEDLRAVQEVLENPLVGLSEQEKFHLVRRLGFFDGFADSEIIEVIQAAQWESQPSGAEVLKQGEAGRSVYVIVTGNAWVKRDGNEIAMLSEGDCFGEMGYLSNAKRSASVEAVDKLTLLRLDKPVNEWASLPCQLRLNKAFLRVLIERLATTSGRLAKQMDS